ncbi:MAG: alpha/beta hydrolase [Nocardioidaceae bacterium]
MEEAFEPVFSTAQNWRRIYVDLPGTGGSPRVDPQSDAVLDAMHESVTTLLRREPFLLAGCSYGGYLAAGLARRLPRQVSGLFLVCAGVKIRPEARNLTRALPSSPGRDWLAQVPDGLHEHFDQAIGCQTRSVATHIAQALGLNGPTDDDFLDTLRSTGYPLTDETSPHCFDGNVTILAGTRDRIAGYIDQFDALIHYPRGTFVALSDAGHYLPFEKPERFRSVALDWLTQSGPTTTTPGQPPE